MSKRSSTDCSVGGNSPCLVRPARPPAEPAFRPGSLLDWAEAGHFGRNHVLEPAPMRRETQGCGRAAQQRPTPVLAECWSPGHYVPTTVRRKLPKKYHIIVLLSSIIHKHFKCWTQMFAYMNCQVLRNSMWHSLSRLPPRLNALWVVTKVPPEWAFGTTEI